MKLRSKIQLIFGGTLIVSLVTVGLVSFNSNVGIAKKGTQANMQNAVTLSVGQISSDLDNYLKMAVAAGKDAVITDPKIDKEKKVDVMNRYASDYGFTSGNILDAKGISLKDGTDFSDREYVQRALAGEANECAERTFESLTAIVEDSEKIAMAFEEISVDMKNQAGKSECIKTEMMNISDVVQTNTATAEETAASTRILSSQADSLREIVNQFKLRKEA